MPLRQRQFSQVRSRASSRCHSQISDSTYINQNSTLLNSLRSLKHDCVSCVNKKLTQQKRQEAKKKQKQQIAEHLQTIKKINSMRDQQQEYRQKMLFQAARYNKSLVASQRQSMHNLKKHQDLEATKLNELKQRQLAQKQLNYQRSRKQLESKYHQDIRNQFKQQTSRKQLESSRIKLQDPQKVNNLKLIQENDKYVNMMNGERIKCQRQNRKLILEKSFSKFEQRQKSINEDRKHLERVDMEFKTFTEFQPLDQSPYRTSRSILSSSQNPQDVFAQVKRIETQKTLSKLTQRKLNNNERALQLKRIQEQNRAIMKKKMSSMKSYVQDLTNQLLQKRQKQAEQNQYVKYFKPEKSKVDYFTEEIGKQIEPCHSCDKLVEKKYFGA